MVELTAPDGATERPGQKGSDGPMTRTSSGLQYRDVLDDLAYPAIPE